ncbi:MAG: alpha/beta hydrolase [bacterium]|nr:alpha/beta hydrolase [bacterium]MCP5070518.1 alpha/beta hydrolase [bacterium]
MASAVEGGPALRRTETTVKGADGLPLFRRTWSPLTPSRSVLLVHGYAEHSGRYETMASWMARRGAAVSAYDHRGHGRSGGRRAHLRSFDEYLDDLDSMLLRAKAEQPTLPCHLVGHSMGGLITLTYLVERDPVIHSAVTSGAAIDPNGVSRFRAATARALRRVWPTLRMGSGLDLDGLSRNPEVVEQYRADPLVFREMTASLGAEVLSTAVRTASRAADVKVPLLMLHGEEDSLCAARGSREFFGGVASEGSHLRIYPELRHEIFNEPEQQEVYADLWQWLESLD